MTFLKEFRPEQLASSPSTVGSAPSLASGFSKVHLGVRLLIGTGSLMALIILALLAPVFCPINSDIAPSHLNLATVNLHPLSNNHLLGTDYLGRDVLSQALWGARATLSVSILSAAMAASFGSVWGAFSAFVGGIVDGVMMRIVDGLLAIPNIILLLILNSIFSTPTLINSLSPPVARLLGVNNYSFGVMPLVLVITVIAATSWLEAARVARAKVLALKSEEYLLAATSVGASVMRTLTTHLLPNAASVIFVEATLLVSDALLMESGLSFLGLGLGPSTPSWGTMLGSAQLSLMQGNWWSVLVPGLLITLTVGSISLLGEGLLELFGRSALNIA
jgi:ABC-type dipeptide/oligopeptide/nickel transport system permease subunit